MRIDVEYWRMDELETEEDAVIWILVKRKNMWPLRVGNVYREQKQLTKITPMIPMGSEVVQIERWDKTLEMWENNQKAYNTVLIGDMNIDMLKWDTATGV